MSRQQIPAVIVLSLGLATILGACNGRQLENVLRPNPNLEKTTTLDSERDSNTGTSAQTATDTSERSPEFQPETQPGVQLTKRPKSNPEDNSTDGNPSPTQAVAELPNDLPFYPQAILDTITPESTAETGVSIWLSPDETSQIVSYYQTKWQNQGWQVIKPFSTDATNDTTSQELTATVRKADFQYDLALLPVGQDDTHKSKLTIAYSDSRDSAFAIADNVEEATDSLDLNSSDRQDLQTTNTPTPTDEVTANEGQPSQSGNNTLESSLVTDLAEVPETLRQHVADVTALNVVTFKAKTSDNKLQFQPSAAITRGQFAKWLVKANNKFYQNSPGNKIRVATSSSTPAFQDVGLQNPNFAEIQGLAEAGLIPSVLTNDNTQVLFRPNAPLTREDLIRWKVPLDVRKGLTNTDLNTLKETWNFRDLNKVNPETFAALLADYQNGDRSNIKRVFGFTTLLQPQKSVTRAEAAASLWNFGTQDTGITASEILKLSN